MNLEISCGPHFFPETILYENPILIIIIVVVIHLQSLLNELSKEVGSSVKIGNFFRMEIGEGIQR